MSLLKLFAAVGKNIGDNDTFKSWFNYRSRVTKSSRDNDERVTLNISNKLNDCMGISQSSYSTLLCLHIDALGHPMSNLWIRDLLHSSTQLTDLSIVNTQELSEPLLAHIVVNYRKLKILNLFSHFLQIPWSSVHLLSHVTSSLRNFSFSKFTDATLTAVLSNKAYLTDLNVSRSFGLTDGSVMLIGCICPLLTSLNISECELLSNRSIQSLSSKLPRLTSIEMARLVRIDAGAIEALTTNCLLLQHLLVSDNMLCSWCYTLGFTFAPSLCFLSLRRMCLTDRILESILSCCIRLHYLDISYNSRLSGFSIRYMAVSCSKTLEYLTIAGLEYNISDSHLQLLPKTTKVSRAPFKL